MRVSGSPRGNLFRHDCRIAINTIRATFTGWHDRLIAATLALVALVIVRSWLVDRPWKTASWAVLGGGILLGLGIGRLVSARLGFHCSDGVLAVDALHSSTRKRYIVASHGLGMAILAAITLFARPSLLIVSVPAYLVGAFIVPISACLTILGAVTSKARRRWPIGRWLHRPGGGIAAAIILLSSLWPTHTLGTNPLMAIVGLEVVLLSLALTIVDAGIVRFKTIAGHGCWRIIGSHTPGLLLFVGLITPVCWVALGPAVAGMVVVASAAILLLLTMRILAYRLHDKRFADLVVSIFAGLIMLVAYVMPLALPFVIVAILWQLQHRAATKTWLLE